MPFAKTQLAINFGFEEYDGPIPSTWEEYEARKNEYQWKTIFESMDVPTDSDIQHLIDLYDGCIAFADRHIGYLLKIIDELNLMHNTIIVITADHGEAFYEHEVFEHGGDLYQEQLHVPFIIKLPTGKDQVINDDIGLIDFTPTVLDLLDIEFEPPSYNFQGLSLVPLMQGHDFTRGVFSESLGNYEVALKNSRWKYLHMRLWKDKLYDIISDPYEGNNIIFHHPEVAEEMLARIKEFDDENKKLRTLFGVSVTDAILDEETVEKLKALGYMH